MRDMEAKEDEAQEQNKRVQTVKQQTARPGNNAKRKKTIKTRINMNRNKVSG